MRCGQGRGQHSAGAPWQSQRAGHSRFWHTGASPPHHADASEQPLCVADHIAIRAPSLVQRHPCGRSGGSSSTAVAAHSCTLMSARRRVPWHWRWRTPQQPQGHPSSTRTRHKGQVGGGGMDASNDECRPLPQGGVLRAQAALAHHWQLPAAAAPLRQRRPPAPPSAPCWPGLCWACCPRGAPAPGGPGPSSALRLPPAGRRQSAPARPHVVRHGQQCMGCVPRRSRNGVVVVCRRACSCQSAARQAQRPLRAPAQLPACPARASLGRWQRSAGSGPAVCVPATAQQAGRGGGHVTPHHKLAAGVAPHTCRAGGALQRPCARPWLLPPENLSCTRPCRPPLEKASPAPILPASPRSNPALHPTTYRVAALRVLSRHGVLVRLVAAGPHRGWRRGCLRSRRSLQANPDQTSLAHSPPYRQHPTQPPGGACPA